MVVKINSGDGESPEVKHWIPGPVLSYEIIVSKMIVNVCKVHAFTVNSVFVTVINMAFIPGFYNPDHLS